MRSSTFPMNGRLIGTLISGVMLAASAPALADEVGEVGEESVTYDYAAGPVQVIAGVEGPSKVHINQIGDQNTITLTQSQIGQLANVSQSGNQSQITLEQQDEGNHFALIEQSGDFNELDLAQSGAGQQIASLSQTGNGNMLLANQSGASDTNGIFATQLGSDNMMSATQSGSENHAILTQTGSGNTMTSNQSGDNNSLVWNQNGDNLSDLAITQTGGQTAQVTQSR